MTDPVFVKHYDDPQQRTAARRHLAWLQALDAGIRLPALLEGTADQLVFEHLGTRHPGPEHLCDIAEALGRLHTAAYDRHLHAARLDQPFQAGGGLLIADFVQPRRHVLQHVPLQLDGLPAVLYKDANIRNFLLVDRNVALVDFDTLTLAPFGYDLAKLVVSTVMTHGPIAETAIAAALHSYNSHVGHLHASARCSEAQFDAYAQIHHLLTRPYLGRNGYRYTWPDQRPAPRADRPAARSPRTTAATGHVGVGDPLSRQWETQP